MRLAFGKRDSFLGDEKIQLSTENILSEDEWGECGEKKVASTKNETIIRMYVENELLILSINEKKIRKTFKRLNYISYDIFGGKELFCIQKR